MMTYDEVLPEVYKRLDVLGARRPAEILILRNMRGSVALVTREAVAAEIAAELGAIVASLGPWGNPEGQRLFTAEDLSALGDVFGSSELMSYRPEPGSWELKVLHRFVTGTEWLGPGPREKRACRAPRVVFYGIKGGVGRSTALSVTAYELARKGKNVLLVDLDLESPGLSGLLLPPEESWTRARFGVVDYLAETAVDPEWSDWEGLVSSSPLEKAPEVLGKIKVIAAGGSEGSNYLEKLSRIYADLPGKDGEMLGFSRRIARMIDGVAASLKPEPDVILIDSRAGLHDIAASSVVVLADLALLFAVDTPQTWEDYRLLFDHWLKSRATAEAVRERLQVVDALFPLSSAPEGREADFLAKSFELFSMLYDEIEGGEPGDEAEEDAFSFGLEDGEAPHSPWRTCFSPQLLEFDPIKGMERVGAGFVEHLYDDFLGKFMVWLESYDAD
jgi:cellulose biosynthesis protein BcsQ